MNQPLFNKIETKVADTILEKRMEIEIGGVIYQVAPPSIATLILVSELVASLPEINPAKSSRDILNETLRVAKDCRALCEIPAVIILGASHLTEKKKVVKKRCLGLVKEEVEIRVDRKKELSEILLHQVTPRELNQLTVKLLMGLEIGDFFGFTTSLSEINLINPTREVEPTTTVSGAL